MARRLWRKWTSQGIRWWEEVLAGPGNKVRREHVVFQFKHDGNENEIEKNENLNLWKVTTDQSVGGMSRADLSVHNDVGIFSGVLQPPYKPKVEAEEEEKAEGREKKDNKRVHKGAFSSMQTRQRYAFRNYDLEDFEYLLLRVKGDGNKYILSLKTENWIVPGANDDLWQTYFHTSKGIWEEIEIPVKEGNNFLLSWRGKLVEEQRPMNYRNLTQMSLAIAVKHDELPENEIKIPFRLEVDWIKALNHSSKDAETE